MQQQRSVAFKALLGLSAAGVAVASAAARADDERSFLPQTFVSSTIPANGDLNPYGVAFVPKGFPASGALRPGDVVVANFNASSNLQGTGTTIVKLTPGGAVAPAVTAGQPGNAVTFFTSPLPGLTTALGVLRRGFVVVGNLPTTDGTVNTISQGALQIINAAGAVVATLTDPMTLDSPWDLTVVDGGDRALVFVANVLSGRVSRLDLAVGPSSVTVLSDTVVAQGYKHEPNASALVLGPTGLAYDAEQDVLYVASTDDNAIFAVPGAAEIRSPVDKGRLVFADAHLRGPLGLAFAPNGHLLTGNGDAVNADPAHPSEIVEFTASGRFVGEANIDAGQDAAFGVATVLSGEDGYNFAAVEDDTNAIIVSPLPER